jgi:hypothetical protein
MSPLRLVMRLVEGKETKKRRKLEQTGQETEEEMREQKNENCKAMYDEGSTLPNYETLTARLHSRVVGRGRRAVGALSKERRRGDGKGTAGTSLTTKLHQLLTGPSRT